MTDCVSFWLTGLFGLVIGSFLNVCIVRLPAGQSIIFPASRCPVCQKPIFWFDNIPLLSFILLRGRCRQCQTALSLRYPLIECLNGLGYLAIFLNFGLTVAAIIYAFFFSTLLVVAAIDLEHGIIPDAISLPGIVVGVVCATTVFPLGWASSLIGLLLGGGMVKLFSIFSVYLFGKEGFGGGDVKLLAMIGAFLGWQAVIVTLLLASIMGAVVGIGLLASGIRQRGAAIPFAPFLVCGACVALLFSAEIVHWYLGIMR